MCPLPFLFFIFVFLFQTPSASAPLQLMRACYCLSDCQMPVSAGGKQSALMPPAKYGVVAESRLLRLQKDLDAANNTIQTLRNKLTKTQADVLTLEKARAVLQQDKAQLLKEVISTMTKQQRRRECVNVEKRERERERERERDGGRGTYTHAPTRSLSVCLSVSLSGCFALVSSTSCAALLISTGGETCRLRTPQPRWPKARTIARPTRRTMLHRRRATLVLALVPGEGVVVRSDVVWLHREMQLHPPRCHL